MKKIRDFEFITGSLSLDFVDTVARRSTDPVDLLETEADLDEWIVLASANDRLPMRPQPHADRPQLMFARDLREAVYRTAQVASATGKLPGEDVTLINRAARLAPVYPQLTGDAVSFVSANDVDGVMSMIAADAIECLRGDNRWRIRQCPGCRMLFVDRSRPGRRRWCSSARGCGNQDKLRRHRARKTEARQRTANTTKGKSRDG